MKTKNKGITLSESLCYIVIFSLLITVTSGYLVYVTKFNRKLDNDEFYEIRFLEMVCNNINDTKFINDEDLYIYVNNSEKLILKGTLTKQIYLEYNYETRKMFNGILGRSINFKSLTLEFNVTNDYVYITNHLRNYHFVIEV